MREGGRKGKREREGEGKSSELSAELNQPGNLRNFVRGNPVRSFDYVTLWRKGKSPIVFPESHESFHFACARGFDFSKFLRRTSPTSPMERNGIYSIARIF